MTTNLTDLEQFKNLTENEVLAETENLRILTKSHARLAWYWFNNGDEEEGQYHWDELLKCCSQGEAEFKVNSTVRPNSRIANNLQN